MLAGIEPGQEGMLPPDPGAAPEGMRGSAQPDIPREMQTPKMPPPVEVKKRRAPERKKTPDEDELIERCYELFEEFRSAYVPEWEDQEHQERIYRGEHWEEMRAGIMDAEERPEPMTPMVQSIIENIQADLMDGFPQAEIQPESPDDADIAEVVGALIAQNHDAQSFREDYARMVHDLLTHGWCVSESGFDSHAYNNIGMGFIRYVNCKNVLIDPQVENVQDARAVFKFQPVTIERLEQMYPEYEGRFESDIYDLLEERDRKVRKDTTKNALLIEYWWREYDPDIDGFRVHMAKVAGHKLLEDSRRAKPEGYVHTGEYPFVVTSMMRRKGSPLGFGLCKSFGQMQMDADRIDQIVMMNALMASRNKMLVQRSSGFDAEDLQDWSKEVHLGDNLGGVTWMSTPPLPQYIIQYSQMLRQTARDESGANDFSRGNTASGVTAASAIAALQEASGKRSRMIKGLLHESYKKAVRMEIEFEREYNLFPRHVRVMRDGQLTSMTFESAMMTRLSETGVDVPIEFFISIKVETQRQWQVQTHNELMLQLMQIGALTPEQGVENMIFEGREGILKTMADARKQAEELAAQQAMLQAAQGGGGAGPSPEEQQAAEAQAQAEKAMQSLPDPKALAQAGGASQGSIVMRQ